MKLKNVLFLFCSIIAFFSFRPNVYAQGKEIQLLSESAALIDAKSGQILYGKNENQRMNPASITKIATAIYAIEHCDLNEQVTVSANATKVEGTKVYLEPGEVVSMEKLLIGMIMNSGNDAAVAIAEQIDGSVSSFAENVNEYLEKKVGVTNTHFENPNCLFGENHYTTAADMAKITKYALQNETFKRIFGMKEYKWDGQSWHTTLLSHHRLLKGEFPYETATITGGKNGFINESGFTLVTAAEKDDLQLIAVTMKTNLKDAPYNDTMQLLDYGFANFKTEVVSKNTIFSEDGRKFKTDEDLYYTVKNGTSVSKIVDKHGLLTIKSHSPKGLSITYQLHQLPMAKNGVETTNEERGFFPSIVYDSIPYLATVGILVAVALVLFKQKSKPSTWSE